MTDGKQVLAGFGDDHDKDPGPVSERRDRTGVRGRRSEDREAFAAAGMNEQFDQQRQEYQRWVQTWTDNGTTCGPSPVELAPSQILTGHRSLPAAGAGEPIAQQGG
jgi:hypothetical protein